MEVLKIAAFSHKNQGGNPAGVVMCTEMPSDEQMLKTALYIVFSETAFNSPGASIQVGGETRKITEAIA